MDLDQLAEPGRIVVAQRLRIPEGLEEGVGLRTFEQRQRGG